MNKDVVKIDDKAIVKNGKKVKIVENLSNLDEILKNENKSFVIDNLFYNNIEEANEKLLDINDEIKNMKSNYCYLTFAFVSIFVTLLVLLAGVPADVMSFASVFGTSCTIASFTLVISNVVSCKMKVAKLKKEYMKTEEMLEVLNSLKMKSERQKDKLLNESVQVENLDVTSSKVGKLVDYKIAKKLVLMYQKGLISSEDFFELMDYDMENISDNILEDGNNKVYKKNK